MSAYADSSFLCAFYLRQANSDKAITWMETASTPVWVTALTKFEFEQGVRFEVFRHSRDHTKGYSEIIGLGMLAQFEIDLSREIFALTSFDTGTLLGKANALSEKHTIRIGIRTFDLPHVATALILGMTEFLSFDGPQRKVAEAEGLLLPV